jgi:hypothetical protein
MWPAVKRGFTPEAFRDYVASLPLSRWRPNKFVWHNTAAPSLQQWLKSSAEDKAQGLVPGQTRIGNLESFFKNNNGWSGCPHLFIAPDLIWVMNPLTAHGVHSPSWNDTSIGIEMIGDYNVENDEDGNGLAVKQNTILATAILCSAFGIEPSDGQVIEVRSLRTVGTIFLHKQDPKTTHDCPGRHIADDKLEMISAVRELMTGGEHNPDPAPPLTTPKHGTTIVGGLNFRSGPGVANKVLSVLPANVPLTILGEAANGDTTWLRVRTPLGYEGWVGSKYVKQES